MLVGAQDNRHRVPADDRAETVFDRTVARMMWLFFDRDCVQVRRRRRVWDRRSPPPRAADQFFEEEMRALRSFDLDHTIQRVQPFPGFDGSQIFSHSMHPPRAASATLLARAL